MFYATCKNEYKLHNENDRQNIEGPIGFGDVGSMGTRMITNSLQRV